jgi:ABC-type sulfate transport system permease subunit
MVSFKSPTVPCQLPTIFVEFSAFETGVELFAQDVKQNPKTTTAIAFTQGVQLDFMRSTPLIILP